MTPVLKRLWTSWSAGMQLAVVGSVVFLLAAAGTRWVDDRGAFPDWFAAVATFAAFGAAAVAARYAADVQQRESRRDQARARDQRRAQASVVAAWPDSVRWGTRQEDGLDEDDMTVVTGVSAFLRNASDVPVTEVRIDFTFVLLGDDAKPIGAARMGSERRAILEPTLEPITVWLSSVTDENPILVPDADEAARTEVRVDITFTDSAGRRWHRSAAGVLVRASPGI